MRVLVDTNVLLRAIQHDNPLCGPARKALKILHRQNHELCLTPQNVKEFWNACTRPTDKNGLGISIPVPSVIPSCSNDVSQSCRTRLTSDFNRYDEIESLDPRAL